MNYKLAFLGLASCCLANIAFAAPVCPKGSVCFDEKNLPDIRNMACESEERFATFSIMNENQKYSAALKKIKVNRLAGDDFPFHPELITVLPPFDAFDCGYGGSWSLAAGGKCDINIELNPEYIDCGDTIPRSGEVMRALTVLYTQQPWQYGAVSQVIGDEEGFDISILGSGDSFSAVGNNICGPDEDAICGFSTLADIDFIEFSQDAAITENLGFFSLYVEFVNDNQVYRYGDPAGGNPSNGAIAENAKADTYAAFKNILRLADKELNNCNYITHNHLTSAGPIDLNAGVYCFDTANGPVVIDDEITFNGPGKFLFITKGTPDGHTGLSVHTGASFVLNNADIEQITWAVEGKVAFKDDYTALRTFSSSSFAGSIVTPGLVNADDNGEDSTQWCVAGRILAYDNNILLNEGFYIDNEYDCEIENIEPKI